MLAMAKSMTDEHKAALAEGREQGAAVRRYLEALSATKRKPGRKPSPEALRRRVDEIDGTLDDLSPVDRLAAIQERMDLERALAQPSEDSDIGELRESFIAHVGPYAARKGLSYAAFREVGVPAADLKAAGIARSA